MTELIEPLLSAVSRKIRALGFALPSPPVLGLLLRTAYLASLKTEEGRFVRGSLTFADPEFPKLDPPHLRRADYPSFTALGRRQPLTVETVVKLSRAIDKWSGSIAVYGRSKSNLFAWGVIDQLVQYNVSLNRESEGGFYNPGIITINIDGIGIISAYHRNLFLGGLSGHRLFERENDALQSNMLAARIAPALVPAAAGITRALGSPVDPDDLLILMLLFKDWANTVARLCLGLRRLGTGGSLLITPAPDLSMLDVPFKLNYQHLGDSWILKVLDDQYVGKIQEETQDSRFSQHIPQDLVSEMGFADADAMDRGSQVNGAVKIVISLAAADGLVLLKPTLNVVGYGVKIGTGPGVATAYDGPDFVRRGTKAKKIELSHFGTRHTSMLRYCRSDRAAVGIVVSQDGHVRLIMSSGRSLTLWDNVKLLGHENYSIKAVRNEQRWRRARRRLREKVILGYSSMPKTMARLLGLNAK